MRFDKEQLHSVNTIVGGDLTSNLPKDQRRARLATGEVSVDG
jgi:hypothetical protein